MTLPGQGAFASNGPLLAFNGRQGGGQAIFAQVATWADLDSAQVQMIAEIPAYEAKADGEANFAAGQLEALVYKTLAQAQRAHYPRARLGR